MVKKSFGCSVFFKTVEKLENLSFDYIIGPLEQWIASNSVSFLFFSFRGLKIWIILDSFNFLPVLWILWNLLHWLPTKANKQKEYEMKSMEMLVQTL